MIEEILQFVQRESNISEMDTVKVNRWVVGDTAIEQSGILDKGKPITSAYMESLDYEAQVSLSRVISNVTGAPVRRVPWEEAENIFKKIEGS